MQKSDLAFSMAVRPCDFDEDAADARQPDWDAVRCGYKTVFSAEKKSTLIILSYAYGVNGYLLLVS